MPVTFDNAAVYGTSTTAVGSTLQFTLTAASNAVLLVFATNSEATGSVSAMARAGQSLTRLGFIQAAWGGMMEVWGLTAPASGAGTISAIIGGNASFWVLGAVTYINATGSTPFGGVATASVNGTNSNLSISCSSTDLLVVAGVTYVNQPSWNNATHRASATVSAGLKMIVADLSGQAGTETASASVATSSDNDWLLAGVPIRFSAVAASSAIPSMALTGAGF